MKGWTKVQMTEEIVSLRSKLAGVEKDLMLYQKLHFDTLIERDTALAEVKRLHEKYDLQLLVKQLDGLTKELAQTQEKWGADREELNRVLLERNSSMTRPSKETKE